MKTAEADIRGVVPVWKVVVGVVEAEADAVGRWYVGR